MYRYGKVLLYLFCIISFGLSESGYNTIYLMEFENLKNDFTNTHLKEALPNLIKENYKFREDLKIEYAGSISPYIKGYNRLEEDSIKALIINGSFQTIDEKFYIEYEVYDFHNWQRLVKRKFYCPINDIICVHDAFLISIESSISPFLLDNIDITNTIQSLQKDNRKIYDLDRENNLGSNAINKNSRPFDLIENIDDKYDKQGKYGNRYYREFEMQTILPSELPTVNRDAKQLEEILDEILIDPYNVVIGDLYLEVDPYNSQNVIGELPIQYSIRNLLSHKSLINISHEKNTSDNSIIFRFSNRDFTFDNTLLEQIALMRFQVMPVVSFNNRIGKAQFIILDSWNDKYKVLQSQRTSILIEDQFKPLFSLTSKSDIVQLTLNTLTLEVLYRFSLPYEVLGDYTKVTVKFMKESELDKLLEISFRGN